MGLSPGPLTTSQIAANSKRPPLAGLFVIQGSSIKKTEGEWHALRRADRPGGLLFALFWHRLRPLLRLASPYARRFFLSVNREISPNDMAEACGSRTHHSTREGPNRR